MFNVRGLTDQGPQREERGKDMEWLNIESLEKTWIGLCNDKRNSNKDDQNIRKECMTTKIQSLSGQRSRQIVFITANTGKVNKAFLHQAVIRS
jgi:hypothetical protein